MDYKTLFEQMTKAFPEKPFPPMSLHQGRLGDFTMEREITKEEWKDAYNKDYGVTWKGVSDADLMGCEVALAHLDEISFVYYLPAFMLFAARNIHVDLLAVERDAVGGAIFSVTNRSGYNLARLKKLDDPQIDAVIAFLRFVEASGSRDAIDASKALNRYWQTPQARQKTLLEYPKF